MEDAIDSVYNFFTQPFVTDLSVIKIMLVFIILLVVAYMVHDMMQVISDGAI